VISLLAACGLRLAACGLRLAQRFRALSFRQWHCRFRLELLSRGKGNSGYRRPCIFPFIQADIVSSARAGKARPRPEVFQSYQYGCFTDYAVDCPCTGFRMTGPFDRYWAAAHTLVSGAINQMSRDLVVEEIEIHQRASLRSSLKPSKAL
jgi:hypothetical protein